ncbi:uncharacterized protein TRAVEDRAFT_74298 [Trametes versicolor FP-101664 SS1]|uniref:uncharacterized protein n=1 Tax=Trametes versicolor (strain FP-101664) TaxID=717944 RepID=UPI0004624110|nr:uncharacterized protein TRAVEDRAFT_74298 [Trametes versicolor FP-101664 SS1]EIW53974.1 hypothetical protein TRAVEDRAFT_74298 [Trametes versicolor FP-101664 SS1]
MHPVCMRPPTKKTSLIQALLWLNENTIGCNFKPRCARSGVSAMALLVSQATHGGDHTIENVLSSSTLEFSKALSIRKILAGPGIWDGPNLEGQASFTVVQAPRLGTPAAAARFAFTSIIRASTYATPDETQLDHEAHGEARRSESAHATAKLARAGQDPRDVRQCTRIYTCTHAHGARHPPCLLSVVVLRAWHIRAPVPGRPTLRSCLLAIPLPVYHGCAHDGGSMADIRANMHRRREERMLDIREDRVHDTDRGDYRNRPPNPRAEPYRCEISESAAREEKSVAAKGCGTQRRATQS